MAATYVLWDARGNEGPGGKGEEERWGRRKGKTEVSRRTEGK